MVYVSIKEESEDKLHLVRAPTTRSWAIFFGLISLGLGAAYYSSDYILWKIAYVSGTVFVGLTCMEDWEECILDKTTKKVTIKKISLIQKLFQAEQGQKIVVGNLDDCVSVSVQKEELAYAGTGYIVVMVFGAGYQLGVTETTNIGGSSDQEYISEKINIFLGLDQIESPMDASFMEKDVDTPEAGAASAITPDSTDIQEHSTGGSTAAAFVADSNSSTEESDDSFEQIDTAELINMNEIDADKVYTGTDGAERENSGTNENTGEIENTAADTKESQDGDD